MAEPVEFWLFVGVSSMLFVAGATLTGLSYRAYLRIHREALRIASAGFGLITVGGLLELLYQIFIRQDYRLGARELLVLQTVESLVIAIGLGVIFVALSKY